jgi:outer membrane autotransporter protein
MTVIADAHGAATGGVASAVGISVAANQFAAPAASFTALIFNSGSLRVEAIASSTAVKAVGIQITGQGAPIGTGVGHITNSAGDIFAGISLDGGDTFYRGTAINVANAPNPIAIVFSGAGNSTSSGGHIYGNVFLSTDDSITVVNGVTCFNGVVNQPYTSAFNGVTSVHPYPLTAPFLPSLDNGLSGIDPFVAAAAVGNLNITANGTLVMVNDPKQGAAAAYVSTYTQTGSLVLEIRGTTPNGGQGGDNTVGKIVASGSANLGGDLTIVPFAGLYANNASYAIVSAPAGSLNGTWASVSTPSVLLDVSVSNSGTVAVDKKILTVNRVAFNAVPGLTHNEQQVGLGIEKTYSTTLTGDYADLVAKLFQVNSDAQYADALRQLSGVEYGLLANASLSSVRMLNNTVGTHLQVIASGQSDHVGQLIQGVSPAAGGTGIGKGNIWLSAWGNWGDPDAKSSNPATNTSEHGILAGVDFDLYPGSRLGIVVGESNGKVHFEKDYHNEAEYHGYHVGAYGRYDGDTAPWYIEGLGAYSFYENDVTRNILIAPGINPQCCHFPFDEPSSVIAGRARGSYDSHTASLNLEAGWNWDTGTAFDLTPFVGLTWMDASSDSFDEKGFAGGNLHINDAASESFASHLGVRLTTDWAITEHMLISPIVRVEWEHEFEDDLWSVQESFAEAPAGGTFRTVGTGYSDDFLNIGAALGFNISGRVDATIGYEGHYSSDEHDNAVTGRVNLRW